MKMINDTMRIIAFLICVVVTPAQTTLLEQDNVIEFLLQKVAELERNQQECSSYQSRMQLELNYVTMKLQRSERRIAELEASVYDKMYDANTENLNVEYNPTDKPASPNVTKAIKKEQNNSQAPGLKGMPSHKPGILRREGQGIATKQIGFYAVIVKDLPSVHDNEIVRFDAVLHDEGNGFNKQTGIFTCPLSGTYVFSVSLMTMRGHITDVHLILNGEVKGNIFADGGNSWDQGSMSSILRCEAGQNVWISVYGGTYIVGDYYTSFSGFLLLGDATGSS